MPKEQQELDAEAIVDKAFEYFEKFVNRHNLLQGILLEGLEPSDDGWFIEIGYNGERVESSEPANLGAMASIAGFGNKTTKTVREVRTIWLDNKGNFKKIS